MHEEASARLVDLVAERVPYASTPSPEEAANALLRGRLGYDGGVANVAPFEPSLLSLPSDVRVPRTPRSDALRRELSKGWRSDTWCRLRRSRRWRARG